MAKIKIGDIFEINTPKGTAYLHYIFKDKMTGDLIRVLPGLYSERPASFEELAGSKERYQVFFPLAAAYKKNIVSLVGYYPADKFAHPKYMRTEHNIKGEFLGWHIVNTENWHRELVQHLSSEQKKLSPWGIWNDTLLVERLITDWNLENWS